MIVLIIFVVIIVFMNGLWILNKMKTDKSNTELLKFTKNAQFLFKRLLDSQNLEDPDYLSTDSRVLVKSWLNKFSKWSEN